MKKVSKFILSNILGWRVENILPDIPKCVIAVAPHTSNCDFIIGKLAYSSLGRNANFLIKKEWFFFPFNLIFKSMGGVPVDRGKKHSLTETMADEFRKRERFQLAITPEGTRKKVKKWKKGFYFIALKANVPIVLIALDYRKKVASFLDVFMPTGNVDEDMRAIQAQYAGIEGKYAEKFTAKDAVK